MTRIKKQRRMANKIVLDKTPKKQERLADPDSYESRKQRAQKLKKKHQSVEAKKANAKPTQTALARDVAAGKRGERHGGPAFADKIRQYNAEKRAQDEQGTEDSANDE